MDLDEKISGSYLCEGNFWIQYIEYVKFNMDKAWLN